MALPPKVKTWQYQVNMTSYDGASSAANSRTLFLLIKNLLKGFASNPWVVWGSNNTASVDNGGGTDYWSTIGDLLPYSWVVLENPVTGMQVCVFFSHASYTYQGTIVVSASGGFGAIAGGTDGTTNTRPTAPDEETVWNAGTWSVNSPVTYKVHAMMSTDGECTRVLVCYNNAVIQFWLFDQPSVPITGFTSPVYSFRATNAATVCTYATYNDNPAVFSRIGSDSISLYMTCEGTVASMIGELMIFQDDDTLEWPIMPIGLFCNTGTHRGRKAAMYDLWWGSTAAGMGNTYPADASNQFVQFSHLIFPWDGSTPETA